MKRYLIPLVALIIGVGMMGDDELAAVRNYTLRGTNYMARFRYRTGGAFSPLTNPPGQPHYAAKANLYRAEHGNLTIIGEDIPCQYTENGCFEDGIEALLQGAGKSYKSGTNGAPWVLGPGLTNETNLIYTNSVVFDKMAVGTNAQDYLDAARYFRVATNLVDLIAASGEWCKVRWHDWRDIVGTDRQVCVICWQRKDKPVPAPWSGWTTNNLWMTNYVIPLAQ